MIAAIEGILENKGADWAIVKVGGISVKISVPAISLANLGASGAAVRLHTHLYIRENVIALYGFSTSDALQLFEELIEVRGVGGKLALSLLSTMSVDDLVSALVTGDHQALMRVPGVGKTTAGRLILELKDKLGKAWQGKTKSAVTQDDEVVSALVALGYSNTEAQSATRTGSGNRNLPLEERVRLALLSMERA